ncbi:hypothetical protein [Citrobacter arsenatis]|uniref:hypothetical protein n=1 Tax=Citrobacter arsenatis TaxID=2546350 RepID=UPI00300DCAB1
MTKKQITGAWWLFLSVLFSGVLFTPFSQAVAGTGDVRFLGAVTNYSCDVIVEVNGVRTTLAQLGTAPRNGSGPLVNITITPDMSQPGCQAQDFENSNNPVGIIWQGPFIVTTPGDTPTLLKPLSGRATDAVVDLQFINANDGYGQWFNPADFMSGAKYTAQLKAGNKAGDFYTAAAFVVVYQ